MRYQDWLDAIVAMVEVDEGVALGLIARWLPVRPGPVGLLVDDTAEARDALVYAAFLLATGRCVEADEVVRLVVTYQLGGHTLPVPVPLASRQEARA